MTDLAITKYLGKWRSREQWKQLVAGHRDSGLSVAGYCDREGISTASFHRWRSLLRDTPRESVGKTGKAVRRPKTRVAKDFVDLGMMSRLPVVGDGKAARHPGDRVELRLEFGGGIVLTLSRG